MFEGSGFRAAAVRSVVVGLTMLAKQGFPHKVFANLPDAADWLDAELAHTVADPFSARDLCRAIRELRARIPEDV